MPQPVDIKEVLKESVSEVSIDALSRKGFKQVKVLNQGTVMRLIAEAVDRVLAQRSKQISSEEREKVIKESRSQFEALAKKRLERERSRIDELEQANQSLTTELETLRKRATASVAVQADRDQALARANTLDAESARLREEIAKAQAALAQRNKEAAKLEAAASAKTDELDRLGNFAEMTIADLKDRTGKAEAEQDRLREALLTSEKRTAELEGLLSAKSQEVEQARAAAPQEATMSKVLSLITDRLDKAPETSEAKDIKLALDGLARRISNLSIRGVASGDTSEGADQVALESFFSKGRGESVESNVSKVKVKEAKASAVKGALAKLKELQKGGEDGQ